MHYVGHVIPRARKSFCPQLCADATIASIEQSIPWHVYRDAREGFAHSLPRLGCGDGLDFGGEA